MLPIIEKQFTELENLRINTIERLKHLSEEELTKKPTQDSWSIAQVIEHIYLAELTSFKYMQKKMLGLDSLPSSKFIHSLRLHVVKVLLNLPLKFKIPRKSPIFPKGEGSFSALAKDWEELRQEKKKLYGTFNANTVEKLSFKHPLFGYINASQALEFTHAHLAHHVKQIERIKAAL